MSANKGELIPLTQTASTSRESERTWHQTNQAGNRTIIMMEHQRQKRHRTILFVGLSIILLVMVISSIFVISSSPRGFNMKDKYPASFSTAEMRYSDAALKAVAANLDGKTNMNAVSSQCEATIFVLRHCEKSGDVIDMAGNEHCSYIGFEFAQYLATLFGNEDHKRWPEPAKLYALATNRPGTNSLNFREHETLGPLSIALDLDIDGQYSIGDETQLANRLFQEISNGELCGKLILISWRQPDIPTLARKLGCGPYEGCPMIYSPSTYDEAWQIKYVYDPPKTLAPEKDASATGSIKPKWAVFGTVVNFNFDPLSFSKRVGDYPPGGVKTGGRWINFAEEG